MVWKLIPFFFFLLTSYCWLVLVLIKEFIFILKYRYEYFKSPKTIKYPESIYDKKYGKSNFINVQVIKILNYLFVSLILNLLDNSWVWI